MKMPSVKMPKFVKTGAEYVSKKSKAAYGYASQKLGEGLKYAKKLKKDTVEFVKKNPKQTAAAAGVGAAVVLLGVGIKHLVEKKNEQKFQLKLMKTIASAQNDAEKFALRDAVKRQAEMISTMQDRIAADKEVIDASREIIDAYKASQK